MHPLIEQLIAEGPIVTDGAWGTELQTRGLAIGDFPDAWNLTHPEPVAEVARAYVAAGSRVILTNTFGANRIRLAETELASDVVEINRRGVEISKASAAGNAFVFASIGPSGKMLMCGDVSADELDEAFEEQARTLAAAGADALVVESMSDLEEAKIALAAAKRTGLPVVASMVFDSGRDKDRTMMGQTPEQVADALTAVGADVIGANCGRGIEGFEKICARFTAATDTPLWIKPNAGLPEMRNGRTLYRTASDDFALHIPALCGARADFIGGCCGTNPSFVRAIRAAIEPFRRAGSRVPSPSHP